MQKYIFESVENGKLTCELLQSNGIIWYKHGERNPVLAAAIHAAEGICWKDALHNETVQVTRFPEARGEPGVYYTLVTKASIHKLYSVIGTFSRQGLVYDFLSGPAIIDLPLISPNILFDVGLEIAAHDKVHLVPGNGKSLSPDQLLKLYSMARQQVMLMPVELMSKCESYLDKLDSYLRCYSKLVSDSIYA